MDTTFRIEWDRQRWTVGATRGDATTVVLRGNAPPSGMTVQYVSWIVARLSTWAHGRGLGLPAVEVTDVDPGGGSVEIAASPRSETFSLIDPVTHLRRYFDIPTTLGQARPSKLLLWVSGRGPLELTLPHEDEPLVEAGALLLMALTDEVPLSAAMLLTEVWSGPDDGSGIGPRERQSLGDPTVGTGLWGLLFRKNQRTPTTTAGMISVDDTGEQRLVLKDLGAPYCADDLEDLSTIATAALSVGAP